MASRSSKRFNMVKSQFEADKSLIPSPRVMTVDEAVAPTISGASWETVAGNVQLQLGQWTAQQANSSSGGVWFEYGDRAKKPEFPVHPKMKGKDRPYAAELQPHWERANRLGLNAQATAIGNMALKKDIEELTRGEAYHEVTDQDLEAMFEFPRLRRKVRWHNLKQAMKKPIAWFLVADAPGKIVLRLKKDSPERSGVAIPFGAQLRLEEAKEKGIFDSYQVIYPNVVTEAQLAAEKARERDPALVGLCAGVMYLICSWDLPEDVKKAETDMEALKALKIEG